MSSLIEFGLLGLFLASFAAATILPLSSEVVFYGVYKLGTPAIEMLLVATLGNFLGGVSCYYLGSMGKLEWSERYLKVKHEDILKFKNSVQRYGPAIGLLCWMPIIGDPLAVALGYFRTSKLLTFSSIFIGKALRYLVVLWLISKSGV